MAVLTTYRGMVEKGGIVRLRQVPSVPVGTEVIVVVAQPFPSLEKQERRLEKLSPKEWCRPFDEFAAVVTQEQTEVDVADVDDEELVALVHQVRRERA